MLKISGSSYHDQKLMECPSDGFPIFHGALEITFLENVGTDFAQTFRIVAEWYYKNFELLEKILNSIS